MARGNKFKPEGRLSVQSETTPAAAPVKHEAEEAGLTERTEWVAGKRKRADAGLVASGSPQRGGRPGDRGQGSTVNTAAPASCPAATDGQQNVKRRAQKGAGKAPLSKQGLLKTSVTAVAEGAVKSGKLGRPRSKKKRQASSYAKLGKPAAPACAPAAAVVVLDSARFSTVVAPPPRGESIEAQLPEFARASSGCLGDPITLTP